jgi:hypothetical protein
MTVASEPTALPVVADRADAVAADLRRLATSGQTPAAGRLVDLAAVTAAISLALLEAALPAVDDDAPGAGEAFERAAELTGDAQRHLLTAFHLLAGAHAIVAANPATA